ncbi:hypothetical protein EXIGLDRAFT_750426 [Exidia glandulosa HHB12029]|uniref:SAM domain-containing protein n=1 Tax=Exidia glandulosa HHB12029 TaxID=1314781 RepID=A0A165GQF6_EXIGL|nr:hypothetical protein EXIGLDRAFT_750426 [Exidia glandulosa HHB12029]
MATTTSATSSPQAAVPPKRERVNSNDHPYAIKTTSTALLTRSNSTGTRPHSTHSYTPVPPSPGSPSNVQRGYHKSSRSLSNASTTDIPKPLPMPPSPGTPVRFANGLGQADDLNGEDQFGSIRRSSTLPGLSSSSGDAESPSVAKLLALPENPKLWTPSHLSSYLTSTLRFKQDASLPQRIAQDLSHFVYEHKLTGRVFLRLTETDLNDMGVNPLWRDALLASSRGLRKRVLQGRIWGFGSPVAGGEEEGARFGSSRSRRFPSTVDESGEEEDHGSSPTRPRGHVRVDSAGRVRAMAASIERTASNGSDGARPSSRLGNGNGNETDEEIMSASDVSDIELTEEEAAQLLAETNAAAVSGADAVVPPLTPEPIPVPDVAIVVEDTPELTVEQLLATNGKGAGAEAWEFEPDDENGNGTAKRLPVPAPILTSRPGSRKGTAKSRGNTIGRKNGAPLADLFRASSPEPPATPAVATATQEEVAILRARVEDLEERLAALAQREAETRRLLEESRAAQLQLEIAHVQAELAREEREKAEQERAEAREQEERGMLNPSPGQIPAYVVLVGVGLCAVIVQSVLRKFAFGRAR